MWCERLQYSKDIQTIIHPSFINIRWGPSPFLHGCRLSGRNLRGAEPRFELGPALQQASEHLAAEHLAAEHLAAKHLAAEHLAAVPATAAAVSVVSNVTRVAATVRWLL